VKHTYAVIEDDVLLVAVSTSLARARVHRKGVYGRRIIRVGSAQENAVRIKLRDMRGGTFHITGVEVQ